MRSSAVESSWQNRLAVGAYVEVGVGNRGPVNRTKHKTQAGGREQDTHAQGPKTQKRQFRFRELIAGGFAAWVRL
jgi:hypothetical protein